MLPKPVALDKLPHMHLHLELDKKRLFSILITVFIFLSIMIVLLFVLYLIGNYQVFLDNTQLMLISLLSVCIVVHLVCGVMLFVVSLLQNDEPDLKRRRAIMIGVAIVFSFILFLGIRALQTMIFF
jgi:magnesium-transporting ATPase (P-type)